MATLLPDIEMSPACDKSIFWVHNEMPTMRLMMRRTKMWKDSAMHMDKPKMRGAGLIVSPLTDQRDGYLALSTGEDNVKVSILHPQGSSRSFSYTSQQDILTIPVGDVLSKELEAVRTL